MKHDPVIQAIDKLAYSRLQQMGKQRHRLTVKGWRACMPPHATGRAEHRENVDSPMFFAALTIQGASILDCPHSHHVQHSKRLALAQARRKGRRARLYCESKEMCIKSPPASLSLTAVGQNFSGSDGN